LQRDTVLYASRKRIEEYDAGIADIEEERVVRKKRRGRER
jgi:hypothetical protein